MKQNFILGTNKGRLNQIGASNNLSCELGPIMAIYDFLGVRRIILSNVRIDLTMTYFHFWSTFHVNWSK